MPVILPDFHETHNCWIASDEVCYTKFHPNRGKYVEMTGRNSFTSFSKCDRHCASLRFFDNSLFTTNQSTNQRTSWSRVLPKGITGTQLVKKFPEFYETRRFLTAFTTARYLSLSRARPIQSVPNPTSGRSILILPLSTPGYSKLYPSLRFPHQNPTRTSPRPNTCYMPSPAVFFISSPE